MDEDDELYWITVRATLPNGKQFQHVYIVCSHVVDNPVAYHGYLSECVNDMVHNTTGPLSSRCKWEAFAEPYQEFLLN